MLNVKIKKFDPTAIVPTYAKHGDAGLDLTAVSKHYDENGNVVYGTGLGFEIPFGYVGLLFPRSSNSKKDLTLTNSVGVIDSGYRGEVSMKFKPTACFADVEEKDETQFKETVDYVELPQPKFLTDQNDLAFIELQEYEIGDRIGQIVIIPIPQINFVEVEELEDSERGSGGYGSTGK